MASEKKSGLTLPGGILQPTTRPEPVEEPADVEDGAGGPEPETSPEPRAARARRRKPTVRTDKVEGYRIYLTKGTHFRLKLASMMKGCKVSELAEELLDRNLPRFKVDREG